LIILMFSLSLPGDPPANVIRPLFQHTTWIHQYGS
jgi:hypothetical protein